MMSWFTWKLAVPDVLDVSFIIGHVIDMIKQLPLLALPLLALLLGVSSIAMRSYSAPTCILLALFHQATGLICDLDHRSARETI